MTTADQLLCHAVGDYILQSHWMATEKTKQSLAALCHVIAYGLPFLFLRPSVWAMLVIVGTHFVIDRWRLARFVVWLKNFLNPRAFRKEAHSTAGPGAYHLFNFPFAECAATGYPPDTPAWLSVWLLIIADNIMHVAINGLALRYL